LAFDGQRKARWSAWDRLAALVDAFGPRFSGTESLEESLDWILQRMSEDGLEKRASEAAGKIVLFDAPFTDYGETVQYRGRGAVAAAQAGAIASLIRSVTPFSMNTPHTGGMSYEDGVPQIPHAAITLEDASMLHRMQDRGDRIEVLLKMEAKSEGMVPSRNIMAEVVGREFPDEVVVLGGHSDSWDVGQGRWTMLAASLRHGRPSGS